MKDRLNPILRQRAKALLLVFFMLMLLIFDSVSGFAQRGQTGNRREMNVGPPRYFALIIGNNSYRYLKRLNTAINDAVALERALRESYGFQTKLLTDAGREQIVNALNEYRRTLDEQSYLLIYYAGHGFYDRSVGAAYWQPVDARPDSDTLWISADDVTRNIKGVAAPHVLVISDSCYSGMLGRDDLVGIMPAERRRFLDKMREGRSRILIASGGNEPVDDGGGGGHSVFAGALLRGLRQIESDEFTASELFNRYILEQVAGKARQTPEYGVIRNSGHDSGDFVFKKAGNNKGRIAAPPVTPSPEDSYWNEIKDSDSVENYRTYLVKYPNGKYMEEARRKIRQMDRLEWRRIENSTNSDDFKKYLSMFEDGEFRELAIRKIKELESPDLPKDIEIIQVGKSKTEPLAPDQIRKYGVKSSANTPLLFAFEVTPHLAISVEIYDPHGKSVKSFTVGPFGTSPRSRKGKQEAFTPQLDGLYIVKLTGRYKLGNYSITLSRL